MSKLILIGLVVAWAVMLAPDAIRFISRGRRGDTMRSFSSQIASLGSMNRSARQGSLPSMSKARRTPAEHSVRLPMVPAPSTGVATKPQPAPTTRPQGPESSPVSPRTRRVDPRRRRQDVLVVLGAAAILTLLATVAFGGIFLPIHLVVDIALIAYLVALAQVMNMIGAPGSHRHIAEGPARRTVARHSLDRTSSTAKPALRLTPQPIAATTRIQPVAVAARSTTR
jgi:hypothetical protein